MSVDPHPAIINKKKKEKINQNLTKIRFPDLFQKVSKQILENKKKKKKGKFSKGFGEQKSVFFF